MVQAIPEIVLHHGVFAAFSDAKPSRAPPIAVRIRKSEYDGDGKMKERTADTQVCFCVSTRRGTQLRTSSHDMSGIEYARIENNS